MQRPRKAAVVAGGTVEATNNNPETAFFEDFRERLYRVLLHPHESELADGWRMCGGDAV